ncbi:MAG: trypsin-like peptidase domain-containing protein [Defluviitaleaceae bacterium]|nr:trypsin-like peptidase domain-containing protein [Defluviitaleaceae bacterium]
MEDINFTPPERPTNPYRKSGIEGHVMPMPPQNHWEDDIENFTREQKNSKSSGKFGIIVATVLIATFLVVPLFGAGVGLGVQLTNNYILPRLLNDSYQRENFAFGNIHTPLGADAFLQQNSLVGRDNYVALVNAVKPSVVTVTVTMPRGGGGTRAGTGILMYETNSRYYIATNAHVIEGGEAVRVSIEGSSLIPAVPIGRDDDNDLAVIAVYKSDAVQHGVHGVVVARFGDSEQSEVGEIVLAIGNAMGEGITVTNGIVSAIGVTIHIDDITLNVMQTNAAINRGNSGGPLVNVFGEVIGINTAKYAEQLAEGMGYAIPSHVAKPILQQIMQQGAPARRPTIGITIAPWGVPESLSFRSHLLRSGHNEADLIVPREGVMVYSMSPYGPARYAGMLLQDIIVAIDGVSIANFDELVEVMLQKDMGQTAVFTVVRGGIERIDISVVLGEYAAQNF